MSIIICRKTKLAAKKLATGPIRHALPLKMDPSSAPLVQILITGIQQQVVASAFGRSRGRRNDQWDYAGHTLLPRCTQGWPPGLLLGLYKAGMYQAPHGYSFTRAPVHDAHILLLQHLHHCCSIQRRHRRHHHHGEATLFEFPRLVPQFHFHGKTHKSWMVGKWLRQK